MKEIKLWEITQNHGSKPTVTPLMSVINTETENLLEEILVHNPDLLLPDLKLVGRQTETAGGPLDLLGVDSDGNLVVFELKRGLLSRDAIAQALDYASYLSLLEPEELSRHISERSGRHGIDKIEDFRGWYQEQFSKDLTNSIKIRIFLVGLGADDRTRRMVNFLANSNLDISLINFYGFVRDDKILLARHVEIQAKTISDETRYTKQNNLEKLKKNLKSLGIGNWFFEIGTFFRNALSAYEYPSPTALSYSLPEITESGSMSYRAYVSLYLTSKDKIRIYLHPRAVEAGGELLKAESNNYKDKIIFKDKGDADIIIRNYNEWQKIVPFFEKVVPIIIDGWKKKREQDMQKEYQESGQIIHESLT